MAEGVWEVGRWLRFELKLEKPSGSLFRKFHVIFFKSCKNRCGSTSL